MPRLLFAQLFVVALITWALRQGMVESELWAEARSRPGVTSSGCVVAVQRAGTCARWLPDPVMYGVWNLVAGTYGFFFPYIPQSHR